MVVQRDALEFMNFVVSIMPCSQIHNNNNL